MEEHITQGAEETQALARQYAKKLTGATILCLEGDLGSGKTTFTQGLLEAFGAEGPYVSPTFLIMKEYSLCEAKNGKRKTEITDHAPVIDHVYHIDAYRIGPDDMQLLGWEEIVQNDKALIIIEWPKRIQTILPDHAQWIYFEWLSENKRKLSLNKIPFITSHACA